MKVIRIVQYLELITRNGSVHRYQNRFPGSSSYNGASYVFAGFACKGGVATLGGENSTYTVVFAKQPFVLALLHEGDGNRLSRLMVVTRFLNASEQPTTTYQERYIGINASIGDLNVEMRFRSAMDSVLASYPNRTFTRQLVGPLPINADISLQ